MLEALGIETNGGCFLAVAFVLIFALFAGLGSYLQSAFGWEQALWLIAAGLIVAAGAVVGFKRGSPFVFRATGGLLLVSGVCFTAVVLFDFVRSLVTGQSMWAGAWQGRDFGIWAAVIAGIGLTAALVGWGLIQQARRRR